MTAAPLSATYQYIEKVSPGSKVGRVSCSYEPVLVLKVRYRNGVTDGESMVEFISIWKKNNGGQ